MNNEKHKAGNVILSILIMVFLITSVCLNAYLYKSFNSAEQSASNFQKQVDAVNSELQSVNEQITSANQKLTSLN